MGLITRLWMEKIFNSSDYLHDGIQSPIKSVKDFSINGTATPNHNKVGTTASSSITTSKNKTWNLINTQSCIICTKYRIKKCIVAWSPFFFVFIMLDYFITNFQYRICKQEAITTFIKHLIFFLQLKTWFKPLVINKITKRFVAEL